MRYGIALGGSMAGKTITLNGVKFKNGLCVLPDSQLSNLMNAYGGLIQYFSKCYQAEMVEVKHDQPKEASAEPESDGDRSVGSEPSETQAVHGGADAGIEATGSRSLPSGDGHQDSRLSDSAKWTARQRRIASAVESLDPDNDEHWTQPGLPRVDAVEQIMGDSSVTRQEITAVAPEFYRPGMNSIS